MNVFDYIVVSSYIAHFEITPIMYWC